MKKQLLCGALAAVMMAGALPMALAADQPMNVTIAPRPDNVTIAPNPAARLTRTAVVTRLWELSGKPQVDLLLGFTDVETGTEAAEAIRWAAAEGITTGYTDIFFGGGDAVTREQLAAMVYRFVQRYGMGFRGAWMFYLGCEDLGQVKEWAMEPMYWMVASRLYDGNAKLLRPQDAVTAEEAEIVFTGLAAEAEQKGVDFTVAPVPQEMIEE